MHLCIVVDSLKPASLQHHSESTDQFLQETIFECTNNNSDTLKYIHILVRPFDK